MDQKGEIDIHTLKCIEKERMRTQCRMQGWEWSIPQEENTSATEKKNSSNHGEPSCCALKGWMAEWDSEMK